jgi:hypothetical protein
MESTSETLCLFSSSKFFFSQKNLGSVPPPGFLALDLFASGILNKGKSIFIIIF